MALLETCEKFCCMIGMFSQNIDSLITWKCMYQEVNLEQKQKSPQVL